MQRNGLKLLILDNESKFHTKRLVTHMESHGIQIYPGSGKKPWDRSENGYPPRSHDCMLNETEFVETFQDAQEDLEWREKNRNKRRIMVMWKNCLLPPSQNDALSNQVCLPILHQVLPHLFQRPQRPQPGLSFHHGHGEN